MIPKSSTDKRHFYIVGALIAVTTVLMGLLLSAVLPMPVQAAIEAQTIDWLFGLHMWLIALLFALVMVFMLYALIVFRRRGDDDSEGEHFEGNTALEVIWTVVPLILVVIFGFIGVNALNDVTAKADDEEVVKAIGFQWAWSFEYPNGVVSPELVLPMGKKVAMQLETKDVLHSFWVPEFRVKQDLVPGMTTEVRFTPSLQGEYKLLCSELCGLTHWNMVAPVRVVTQEEYTAWLGEQLAAQGQQTASK